jgi:hypothetical protein
MEIENARREEQTRRNEMGLISKQLLTQDWLRVITALWQEKPGTASLPKSVYASVSHDLSPYQTRRLERSSARAGWILSQLFVYRAACR